MEAALQKFDSRFEHSSNISALTRLQQSASQNITIPSSYLSEVSNRKSDTQSVSNKSVKLVSIRCMRAA